ncbi:MAG: tetratricopeptide repeat protein [Bdellovibrionales bacterium]
MKIVVFLLICLTGTSCMTTGKFSSYDSVIQNPENAKRDILKTLRGISSLKKEDFSFVSEKMKNIVSNYNVLQNKVSDLEKKVNHLLAQKASEKEDIVQDSNVKIETEKMPKDLFNTQTIPVSSSEKKEESSKKKNPKDRKLKDSKEASFTEGKKLFSEKSWQSAISKFQDYIDKNPKGIYAIEAYYYIGESFKSLEMLPEARVFYKEVIKNYPESSWALKAKKRIKK